MVSLVVLDADFLSAFLKIEALPLVRNLYRVKELFVPPAVYRELAVTNLFATLLAISWVRTMLPPADCVEKLRQEESFSSLGAGEQESIALVLDHPEAILLINDNRARRIASSYGIQVVNIPAFLLACRLAGLLDRDSIARLIADLQARDHYGFRQDVLALLLR